MKINILGIVMLVIGLIIIGLGVFFVINENKETSKGKESEQTLPQGADAGMPPEQFYNWETQLNIRAIQLLDETFNDQYTLDENGEFKISLKELKTKYNVDLSEFNTGTISCDLENSVITVTKENGEYFKSVLIKCTNSAK